MTAPNGPGVQVMQVNCCGDLADTAARLGTMAIS